MEKEKNSVDSFLIFFFFFLNNPADFYEPSLRSHMCAFLMDFCVTVPRDSKQGWGSRLIWVAKFLLNSSQLKWWETQKQCSTIYGLSRETLNDWTFTQPSIGLGKNCFTRTIAEATRRPCTHRCRLKNSMINWTSGKKNILQGLSLQCSSAGFW